jgi:hypothetical protein
VRRNALLVKEVTHQSVLCLEMGFGNKTNKTKNKKIAAVQLFLSSSPSLLPHTPSTC